MVDNQTPETSTLSTASTPVYAEPQLTEELLERFDSFARGWLCSLRPKGRPP